MRQSTSADNGLQPEPEQSASAPTAPSPPSRQTDPFEIIDEVPSSLPAEGVDFDSPSHQIEIPGVQMDDLVTIMPPLTPAVDGHDDFGPFSEGHKQLLTKLGGYGWRG